MKNIFYSFISFILIFGACSSQEELAKYGDTQIVFGTGGGFSGQEMQYTLSSDGKINLFDNLSKQTSEVTKLKNKQTLKAFENVDNMVKLSDHIDDPGNKYYFIRQIKGNKETKIVWGGSNYKVSADVQDSFDLLMSYVN